MEEGKKDLSECSDDSIDIEKLLDEDNIFLTSNAILDTNEDLPLRKPQSAYVIFGKMVRDLND